VTLFLHQVNRRCRPSANDAAGRRDRDAALEGRRILVVEDDVRNVFALSTPGAQGCAIEIARNGREAIEALTAPPPRLNPSTSS